MFVTRALAHQATLLLFDFLLAIHQIDAEVDVHGPMQLQPSPCVDTLHVRRSPSCSSGCAGISSCQLAGAFTHETSIIA